VTKTNDLVVICLGTYSDALNQKRLVLATHPAGRILPFSSGQRSSKWPFPSGSPEYYVIQVESAGEHLPIKNGAAPDAMTYRVGEALHEIGNALTPLMVNTQLIVEQSKSDDISDLARVIFNAARRIAFTLRRLRDIEVSQSMASAAKGRMLDLRITASEGD
jgi:hypothetical protein